MLTNTSGLTNTTIMYLCAALALSLSFPGLSWTVLLARIIVGRECGWRGPFLPLAPPLLRRLPPPLPLRRSPPPRGPNTFELVVSLTRLVAHRRDQRVCTHRLNRHKSKWESVWNPKTAVPEVARIVKRAYFLHSLQCHPYLQRRRIWKRRYFDTKSTVTNQQKPDISQHH